MEDHGAMIHFFPQQDSGARDPPVSNEKDAKDSSLWKFWGRMGGLACGNCENNNILKMLIDPRPILIPVMLE